MLIYAGTPDTDYSFRESQHNTAEVIDLLNDNTECDPFINGHSTSIIGASGGKMNDDFVYCGGFIAGMYYDVTKDCRILGKGYPHDPFHSTLNMTIPEGRCTANGGVILPNNTLFIGGTYARENCLSESICMTPFRWYDGENH